MSLNNIKRKQNQLQKNMGKIIIDKYGLNKDQDKLNIIRQLNSNTKKVFKKTKKQNKITTPYTFFKSSKKEEFHPVILNNSNNSNNSTTSLTKNTSEINNTNEEVNLVEDNKQLYKYTKENEEVNLVEDNEQLYKYTKENEELLEKMYENINKIKNKNLYLNIKLKNENKQEDLKALQNYVKTQRIILKKINNNIKESTEIKKKYSFGKIFMKKENKEKLSKLLTKKNKEGIELYVNNAVKKIKKIVHNNRRSKFHNMVENKVIKTTGKTLEERIAELKEQHHNKIKNIKPITRFKY